MDSIDSEIQRFKEKEIFKAKKWKKITKCITLNRPENIQNIWLQAIRNQFSPAAKPVWALFENGSVVFVPTIKYNVPDGISSFAIRVISDHGAEITVEPDMDNDFLLVSTPNMATTFGVKHGPGPLLWTMIDLSEIPEEFHQYIKYDSEGVLEVSSQMFIGALAQKKRIMDSELLNIISSINAPESDSNNPLIQEVD